MTKILKIFFLNLITIFFLLSSTQTISAKESKELKKLMKEQAKILKTTEDNWIEWRYFSSRLMFYYSHIVSYRCGVKEFYWGTDKEDLKLLPLGKPEGDSDSEEYKVYQEMYENFPNGCNVEDPYAVPSILPTWVYLDETDEDNQDSFIGLVPDDEKKETKPIESIFVKIIFYDGKESDINEYKITDKVLKEMRIENS